MLSSPQSWGGLGSGTTELTESYHHQVRDQTYHKQDAYKPQTKRFKIEEEVY